MMDDVTIRLRLFAGGWEATASNGNRQKFKVVCSHWLQAVQELLILLDAQEVKTDTPQSDQFVVPQWVKDCIEKLKFSEDFGVVYSSGSQAGICGLSRFLTSTIDETGLGVFTGAEDSEFLVKEHAKWLKVDFSDLPLTAENFKETLIQRCQRVGQAIMDAERVKPIDPDEGLMSMDEVEKLLVDVKFVDGKVVDSLGRVYGAETSALLTGATCLCLNGIFEDEANDFAFSVNDFRFLVDFDDKNLSDLDPNSVGSEILLRVSQVRKARAQALQEAASK